MIKSTDDADTVSIKIQEQIEGRITNTAAFQIIFEVLLWLINKDSKREK